MGQLYLLLASPGSPARATTDTTAQNQQAPLNRGANYFSSTSSEGSTSSASASRMIVEKRGSTSSFSILDSAFCEIPASLASCSCVQNLATLLALTPRPILTPAIVDTLLLVDELYLTSRC